jgi:hypothetical protein
MGSMRSTIHGIWVSSHHAFLTGLKLICICFQAGKLNLGVRTGPALCAVLRPKYWLQTHDEMKEAAGFVAKVIERRVITQETCQKLVSEEAETQTEVKVLQSGESLQLL